MPNLLSSDIKPEPDLAEECLAIIPIRSHNKDSVLTSTLIQRTLLAAKQSKFVNKIVISAILTISTPFSIHYQLMILFIGLNIFQGLRLSDEVMQYTLEYLENQSYFCDVVVPLEILYPFRHDGLLDAVVSLWISSDYDGVIAAFSELRPCWKGSSNQFIPLNNYVLPRDQRESLLIGLPSCLRSHPSILRKGSRVCPNLGI